MSRARRLPRHRRIPIVSRATVPVAFGGAVAAVAVTASPLADALHRGGSAGPGDGAPDVVMVAPATSSPNRSTDRASRGEFRPQPGAAASAAPHIRVGQEDGTQGGSDRAGSAAATTHDDSPTGGTASSDPSPTADPTSTEDPPNGSGSPPTAPPGQDPTHQVLLPLPTLSTTSLPTLLPTLTPPPLP